MIDLLLLLHEDNTTAGTALEWCESRGLTSRILVASKLPRDFSDEFRALMIFGGDMEVFDEAKYPWLKVEKDFIRKTIESRKPIFGLCLGSQLLAEQFGGVVAPMGKWEIGWYGVKLEGSDAPLYPLHWHSSFFEIPSEAKRSATNSLCVNQGFQIGEKFIGYQFHCEIDLTRLHHVLKSWKPSLQGEVQTREQILSESERRMADLKRWFFARLDRWWAART